MVQHPEAALPSAKSVQVSFCLVSETVLPLVSTSAYQITYVELLLKMERKARSIANTPVTLWSRTPFIYFFYLNLEQHH